MKPIAHLLPRPLSHRHHRPDLESEAVRRRRHRVVTGTAALGAALLGRSLSTTPGSRDFYASTAAVAATWTLGGAISGPLHRGWIETRGGSVGRPVVVPIATGVAAFGVFYAGALIARRIPVLDTALTRVLRFADEGATPWVYATTLANGAAEEVFFRGALYAAFEGSSVSHPVVGSTCVYTLTTGATRNPALVAAAGVMGTLFAAQRRATGGIQAPLLTHVTWSALMLRFLPPLFRRARHQID